MRRRIVTVFVFAVLLMVVATLHLSLVRSSLAFLGLGSAAPAIVSIQSAACWDEIIDVPRALGEYQPVQSEIACDESGNAWLVVSLPANSRSFVFLNGALVTDLQVERPGSRHVDIRLRPGLNRIAVFREGELLSLPFLAKAGDIGGPLHDDRSIDTPLGRIWSEVQGGSGTVHVTYRRPSSQDPAPELAAPVAYSDPASGEVFAVAMGRPGDVIAEADGFWGWRYAIPGTGLSILENVSFPGSAPAYPYRRDLELVRNGTGIEAKFDLCLPRENYLSGLAEGRNATAAGLLGQAFGLTLDDWNMAPLTGSTIPLAVRPEVSGCIGGTAVRISGTVAFPVQGTAFEGDGFPLLPGDRLTVRGAGQGFRHRGGAAPMRAADGSLVWEGAAPADGYGSYLALYWGRDAPLPAADAEEVAEVAGAEGMRRRGSALAAALQGLGGFLPWPVAATLDGLAATLPVLLLALAFATAGSRLVLARERRALVSLLVFMGAMAAQPLISATGIWVLDVLRLTELAQDAWQAGAQLYAPLAIAAAVLVIPVARSEARLAGTGALTIRYPVIAVLLVLQIGGSAAFVLILKLIPQYGVQDLMGLLRSEIPDWLPQVQETGRDMSVFLATIGLQVVWFLASVLMTSAILSQMMAVAAPQMRSGWYSLLAAFFLLSVSAAVPVAEGLWLLGLMLPQLSDLHGEATYRIGKGLAGLAEFGIWAFLAAMVYSLLLAFGWIAAGLSSRAFVRPPPLRLRVGGLLAATALVALPAGRAIRSGAQSFDAVALSLMGTLHDCGAALALVLPMVVLWRLRPRQLARDPARDRGAAWLLAAIYAGYLSHWRGAEDALVIGLLAAAGGAGLYWLVFDPARTLLPEPRPGNCPADPAEAAAILGFMDRKGALDARRGGIGRRLAAAEITMEHAAMQFAELDAREEVLARGLPCRPDSFKRALLAAGPAGSPFANGVYGALCGLAIPLLLEVLRLYSIDPVLRGSGSWWTAILQQVASQDGLQGVAAAPGAGNPVLELARVLASFVLTWPLLGFVFGMSYAKIRGDDGFSKALLMSLLTCLLIFADFAFAPAADGQSQALRAASMAALATTFLILLGVIGFDLVTVLKLKLAPGTLNKLYGIRTTVSFASLLGLLAAGQGLISLLLPLLQ